MVGRPKKELTEQELEQLRQAWERTPGNISAIAEELDKTWQTARRWLQRAGLIEDVNTRLDRPGLVWPHFEVRLNQVDSVIVEAPNWAVACKVVGKVPIEVKSTGLPVTKGYDRESVKEMCPGYMSMELSVKDLMQGYIDKGVMVRT